jgi:Ribbon-helix-helix protein, copG family
MKYKLIPMQTPSGGRPLLGKSRRVQISISIDEETKKRLRETAAQRGLSTGLLIDELATQLV